MTSYEVKDGRRTLQFDGVLLSSSTSRRADSPRWVEFEIYRTASGMFVVSRVGVSATYHAATCYIVEKYNLPEIPPSEIRPGSIPCTLCRPTHRLPLVSPESDRHWAQSFQDAEGVIEALYQYNESGIRYLTVVAAHAIEQAARKDATIEQAYRIEHVP